MIGDNIKKYMQELNMSKEELARKCEMTVLQLERILECDELPSRKEIKQFKKNLKLKNEELILSGKENLDDSLIWNYTHEELPTIDIYHKPLFCRLRFRGKIEYDYLRYSIRNGWYKRTANGYIIQLRESDTIVEAWKLDDKGYGYEKKKIKTERTE